MSNSQYVYTADEVSEQFELLYRQMWLLGVREHDNMGHLPKQAKKAQPKVREADETSLFRCALLAYVLGFRSQEVDTTLFIASSYHLG